MQRLLRLQHKRLAGLGKQRAGLALALVNAVTPFLGGHKVWIFPIDPADQRQVGGGLADKRRVAGEYNHMLLIAVPHRLGDRNRAGDAAVEVGRPSQIEGMGEQRQRRRGAHREEACLFT